MLEKWAYTPKKKQFPVHTVPMEAQTCDGSNPLLTIWSNNEMGMNNSKETNNLLKIPNFIIYLIIY